MKIFALKTKDLKSDFGKVTPKGVKRGVKSGQNGVILITGSFCVPIELSL